MSQQSQPQDQSREKHYQQLDRLERRQNRRTVFFPFLLLLLLVFIIIGILLSLQTPTQVAVVSDFFVTLFVLCPLIICMFIPVVLIFALMGLVNKLHSKSKSPLRRLEQWTYNIENRVEDWAGMVDSRVLDWAVRFAPIRRILTVFDAPSSESQDEGETNDTTRTEK